MENKDTIVTIIIPTWDNYEYLSGALNSLVGSLITPGLMRVIVVNNGHKNSCDWIKHDMVTVIQAGDNLGWEGGIDLGLKHTTSPFVCFFNDDAMIPASSTRWLNKMLDHFVEPAVAAVGPSSNVVMGYQNIFSDTGSLTIFPSTYLIGFCVLLRRSAFDEIGGMDLDLPSGDDLDWSIRLRDKGYKLIVDKNVFVYHHGFKTGTRIMGDHQTVGGWNSFEQWSRTNTCLIKKHGLKKWWECIKGPDLNKYMERLNSTYLPDIEGDKVRSKITDEDMTILDLGCGGNKTLKRAIGVDYIPTGERIETLQANNSSQADIIADVSKELPVDDASADVIIARHILEHMIDPVKSIALWISKLKVGGKLIIAVPNQDMIDSIPMNIEHIHAFNPESLTNLLSVLGLKVISTEDSQNKVSFIAVGVRQ